MVLVDVVTIAAYSDKAEVEADCLNSKVGGWPVPLGIVKQTG